MNKTIFKQYDGPWANKGYPTKRSSFAGNGCGCVACTHIAIEQERYKNWTPEKLRVYMVNKGFAISGQGTTWDGITATLKYLGHDKVVRITSQPMKVAFEELNKGNRIGIILFGSTHGPDGTVWTSNGHYIAFSSYKYEKGKHKFYLKDSGGRGHDGWYSYEKSMKGDVRQMWIVERIGVQVTSPAAVTDDGKLVVDGKGGIATVKATQRFLGTVEDGLISWQDKKYKGYYPALKSVSYSEPPKGSSTVNALQRWLGISPDGILKKATIKALQKKLGLKDPDGIWGPNTMKAWQTFLNDHIKEKAVFPTPAPAPAKKVPTLADKIMDACADQAEWMKNYKYEWEGKPTVKKSKKKGTCVTYVACVLQRLGYLDEGECIWHTEKGKVYGDNKKMRVTYPGGTLKSLKSKLQTGDIIMAGDKKSVSAGGNSHIFILTGKWDGDDPYVWDNQSCVRIKNGKKGKHTYPGSKNVIAVVRLK